MKFVPARLAGVVLIEAPLYHDSRGHFREVHHAGRFADGGLPLSFVQDNLSRSKRGVVRGLHYQITQPQGKLVSVIRGAIYDVAVDLRKSSPTFGEWFGAELSESNGKALYIPPGFAHGFSVTSEEADVLYKCTALYAPADERTVLWNDPAIGIAWPLGGAQPIVSDKDCRGLPLAEAECFR